MTHCRSLALSSVVTGISITKPLNEVVIPATQPATCLAYLTVWACIFDETCVAVAKKYLVCISQKWNSSLRIDRCQSIGANCLSPF